MDTNKLVKNGLSFIGNIVSLGIGVVAIKSGYDSLKGVSHYVTSGDDTEIAKALTEVYDKVTIHKE